MAMKVTEVNVLDRLLKIGIGSDAFPPTTDGVCKVILNYAERLNNGLADATVIVPKNPNQLDYKYDFEIFRYKSWWFPSNEGYTIGWPFNDELHQKIIDILYIFFQIFFCFSGNTL